LKPDQLSSKHNPILKEYRKLLLNRSYRRKRKKIAVEGPNLVREALRAGLVPEVIFMTAEYYDSSGKQWLAKVPSTTKKILLSPVIFNEIVETKTPQSIAAIFPCTHHTENSELMMKPKLVVIADRLQDPGNMGTLIRTAVAAGVDTLFCTAGCTDPFSPKVLRATVGSIFQITIKEVSDTGQLLAGLKEEGFTIVATAGGGENPYWSADYTMPLALIVGNEASGVAADLITKADLVVAIPLQSKVESLNAAVAAGIILFEIKRQESAEYT